MATPILFLNQSAANAAVMPVTFGAAGTIEVFALLYEHTGAQAIIVGSNGSSSTAPTAAAWSHMAGVDASGFPVIYFFDGSIKTATGLTPVSAGPHRFTLAWTNSGTAKLYIDGVLVVQVSIGTAYTGLTHVHFGRAGGSVLTQDWRGYILDARAWSVERSAGDILSDMAERLAGNESNLVRYYRVDEGTGTTLDDETSNNVNGSIYGGASAAWGVSSGDNDGVFSGVFSTGESIRATQAGIAVLVPSDEAAAAVRATQIGIAVLVPADAPDPGGDVPDPPANPAAEALSHSEVRVTWDTSAEATGYKVYRGTATGFTVDEGSLIASLGEVTQYDDSGLAPGTEYFYVVVAFNAESDSDLSTEVSATTDEEPEPTDPGPNTPTLTFEVAGADSAIFTSSAYSDALGRDPHSMDLRIEDRDGNLIAFYPGLPISPLTFSVDDIPTADPELQARLRHNATDDEGNAVPGEYSDVVEFELETEEPEDGGENDFEPVVDSSSVRLDRWPYPTYGVEIKGDDSANPDDLTMWVTMAGQTKQTWMPDGWTTDFAYLPPGAYPVETVKWTRPGSTIVVETAENLAVLSPVVYPPFFKEEGTTHPVPYSGEPVSGIVQLVLSTNLDGCIDPDATLRIEVTQNDGASWDLVVEGLQRREPGVGEEVDVWRYNWNTTGLTQRVATKLRVRAEKEYEEPSFWRTSAPFYIGTQDATLRFRQGASLNLSEFTVGGSSGESGRWAEIESGADKRFQRVGPAGTSGHALLGIVGTPRSFEVIAQTRFRKDGNSGTAFVSEMRSHLGVTGYTSEEGGYSAIAARMRGWFGAWGRNFAPVQPGGSIHYWNQGVWYRKGTGRYDIWKHGPLGTPPTSAIPGFTPIIQWVNEWYTVRAKYTLLGTTIDGKHQVQVDEEIHGPDFDSGAGFVRTRTFVSDVWPCGGCGFSAISEAASTQEFRSISVLVESYGDCEEDYGLPCEPWLLELAGTAQPEAAPPAPIVYPISPDWKDGIRETYHWLTDVITAKNGVEQRIQLRETPGRTLEYSPLSLDEREAGIGDGILWRRQSERIYVPQWQHATFLREDLEVDAETVPCHTALRGFVTGGHALIWKSPAEWEVVEVSAVESAGLTLELPIDANWNAWETQVIPLLVGIIPADLSIARPASFASKPAARFRLEVVGAALPSLAEASPSLYRELPILEYDPDRRGNEEERLLHPARLLDNRTGALLSRSLSTSTPIARKLSFVLIGRTEIHAFLSLVASLYGQRLPIWIPTYARDLPLVGDIEAGSDELLIRSTGYTARQFPRLWRRDIAFVRPGQPVIARRVVDAEDLGNGTERLTLEQSVSEVADFPTRGLVSFLPLCRLGSDDVTVAWRSQELAVVEIETREIPFEVPEDE